jgi:hypothetical protein
MNLGSCTLLCCKLDVHKFPCPSDHAFARYPYLANVAALLSSSTHDCSSQFQQVLVYLLFVALKGKQGPKDAAQAEEVQCVGL